MNNKKDKGFTLVELLIVIVILGILATVTVFAVRGITDKGETNACQVEKRSVETAIEAYYAQHMTDPTSMGTAAAAGDLVPGFIKEPPAYVTVTFPQGGGTPTVAANAGITDC